MRGAFAGIEKVIEKRGNKTSIGFNAKIKDTEGENLHKKLQDVQTEDLVKYGLIPEFIGRLPVLATLEDLDVDALVRILSEPKNALIKQYQYLFEMEDVKLIFTDEGLKAIAQKAVDRKTGARGLRSIMEELLMDTMFDLPSLKNLKEVHIVKETVTNDVPPVLIYTDAEGAQDRWSNENAVSDIPA